MAKKTLRVNTITPKDDGQNGEKRYTLSQGKGNYCILIDPVGSKECSIKIGDSIVCEEKTVSTKNQQEVKNWYFLQLNTEENRLADVMSDYDFSLELVKQEVLTKSRIKLKVFEQKALSMEDLMKATA